MSVFRIEPDDLSRPAVLGLLAEHLTNMHAITPAGSVHAFPAERLRAADVTFWSVWDGDELVGVGALKELDPHHGEVKSMRTPAVARRRGAGRAVLRHILAVAQARGYRRLSLETGAGEAFAPAHALYRSEGFVPCGPFDGYADDPNSVFLTRAVEPPGAAGRHDTRGDT